MVEKIYCKGCGQELTYIERYNDLPCNTYCCGRCCPYAKESPCPMEKRDGGFLTQLSKF